MADVDAAQRECKALLKRRFEDTQQPILTPLEHGSLTILLDHLKAVERERADALRALEPFGELSGEGDEDYADAERVVLKFGRSTVFEPVKLGHLRRAQELTAGRRR